MFQYAVPIMIAAFVLTWLLKEVPLRGRTHSGTDTSRELTAGSAPGTAEPDSIGAGT